METAARLVFATSRIAIERINVQKEVLPRCAKMYLAQ